MTVGSQQPGGDDRTGTGPAVIVRAMLDAIGCVVGDRGAVYVSTPITTGPRYLAWRQGPGRALEKGTASYRAEHRAHVVEPNLASVGPIVAAARDRFDLPVIDPTQLADVPGWLQPDYHGFWTDVVRLHARVVVFAEGWEHSAGCLHELEAALAVDAQLLDDALQPLDLGRTLERLEQIVEGEDRYHLTGAPFSAAVQRVREKLRPETQTAS